jgi:hypothetical protein
MLDCNELAKGKNIKLSGLSISDDNQLPYVVGRRIYTLEVKFNNRRNFNDKIKTRQEIPPGQVIINYFLYYPRCEYLAF